MGVVQRSGARRSVVLAPTLQALTRYGAAVTAHEEQDSIASSEALLEARLAVLQTLVAAGWRPPERLADVMGLDEAVAHLDLGGAEVFERSVPAQERQGALDR